MQNYSFEISDMKSEAQKKQYAKNKRVARKAMLLVIKSHGKLEHAVALQEIANTIGIISAHFVGQIQDAFDEEFALVIRDLINMHMNEQITARTSGENMQ